MSLEGVAPHELLNHGPSSQIPFSEMHPHPELDPLTWLPLDSTRSDPSSTYSGSPSPSETSLPVHAPKPQHASAPFEMWPAGHDSAMRLPQEQVQMHEYQNQHHGFVQTFEPTYEQHCGDMGAIGMDFSQSHPQQMCGPEMGCNNMGRGSTPCSSLPTVAMSRATSPRSIISITTWSTNIIDLCARLASLYHLIYNLCILNTRAVRQTLSLRSFLPVFQLHLVLSDIDRSITCSHIFLLVSALSL
jgi:hypothetical protein